MGVSKAPERVCWSNVVGGVCSLGSNQRVRWLGSLLILHAYSLLRQDIPHALQLVLARTQTGFGVPTLLQVLDHRLRKLNIPKKAMLEHIMRTDTLVRVERQHLRHQVTGILRKRSQYRSPLASRPI